MISLQWVNVSTAYVTASKTGYVSGSKTVTTSDYGPDTIRIEIWKTVVTATPTATPPPGGITVAPTYAPYCNPNAADYDAGKCSTEKDASMMNQVRDAGPILISLAILATIVGLLKLMGKK